MINIMFAGNYKVFDGILIASMSILKHCKESITAYMLTMDLSEQNPNNKPLTSEHIAYLDNLYKETNKDSKVVAVEIDKGLIPVLSKTLAEFDNITVINEDIMKIDIAELVAEHSAGKPVSVCANLPYYITTPILMHLLESGVKFSSITVMVQNEVAQRLAAQAGSSDYGAITAILGYYGTVRKLFKVSAGSFLPPPKVDSAVVRIDLYDKCPYEIKDEKLFRNCIKAAFEMRRKTLENALSAKLGGFSKEDVASAITSCGFDAKIRGERLSTEDFAALSNHLFEIKNSK